MGKHAINIDYKQYNSIVAICRTNSLLFTLICTMFILCLQTDENLFWFYPIFYLKLFSQQMNYGSLLLIADKRSNIYHQYGIVNEQTMPQLHQGVMTPWL